MLRHRQSPYVRPKSEIYTRKRDDEHPHPFHMRSHPPSPPPGVKSNSPAVPIAFKREATTFLGEQREDKSSYSRSQGESSRSSNCYDPRNEI